MIAFPIVFISLQQIVDVTWRYSCKHNEVLKNRTSVSETWLLNMLKDMTTEVWCEPTSLPFPSLTSQKLQAKNAL